MASPQVTLLVMLVDISNIKFLVFSDDRYSEYLRGAAVVPPE